MTPVVIVVVEVLRRSGADVPVPFLLVGVPLLLTATLGGRRRASLAFLATGAYFAYLAATGFGPDRFVGTPGRFVLGLFIIGSLVYYLAYQHDRIRGLLASLNNQQQNLAEVNKELTNVADLKSRELTESDKRLRQTDERYRGLFNNAPIGIFVLNRDSLMIVGCNIQAGQLIGCCPEELLNSSFVDLVLNDDDDPKSADIAMLIAESASDMNSATKRINIQTIDQQRLFCEFTTAKLDDGEQAEILLCLTDRSAQRRFQARLDMYSQVADASDDLLSLVGRDMRYRAVNKRYLDAWGRSAEDMVGRHVIEIVGREFYESDSRRHLEIALGGSATGYSDWVNFTRAGRRYCQITYNPVFGAADEVVSVAVTVSDTTELKNAQDRAEEYARRLLALGEAWADSQESERRHVARELHDDVGQCLTALNVNFARLRSVSVDAPAEKIIDDSERIAAGLIERVRQLSGDLRPAELDDLGLVSALRQHVSRQAERNGFELRFEYRGDEQRLPERIEIGCFRIIQEAVNNIIKHAKATVVTVEITQSIDALELSVDDNGVGFAEPSPSNTNRDRQPMGLISMRERAALLGGHCEVVSQLHGGTRVNIVIPLSLTNTAALT